MKIPSILLHTAKRFAVMAICVAAGISVAMFLPVLFQFSNDHFGSSLYAVSILIVAVMLYFSYQIAKLDVEQEKRRQARVLASLKSE